jgi:hypothetical protein
MNHWLVYWQTYWEKIGDSREIPLDWHSSYEWLYQKAQPGDTFWVVVAGGVGNESQWRLLERFALQTKSTIDETIEGFKYRFEADVSSQEVFDPKSPNDLTPILTGLTFASDHPIRSSGRRIGMFLQSPRKLAEHDATMLHDFAISLPRV